VTHCNIENISVYLDGEMPEAEAARLRGHLEECPSCRALYQDLSALQDGFAGLERKPPDTLAPGVMYKIGLGDEPSRAGNIIRRLVAVAACLAAALLVSRYAFPTEQYDAQPETSLVTQNAAPYGAGGGAESWPGFDGDTANEIAPRLFGYDESLPAPAAFDAPEAESQDTGGSRAYAQYPHFERLENLAESSDAAIIGRVLSSYGPETIDVNATPGMPPLHLEYMLNDVLVVDVAKGNLYKDDIITIKQGTYDHVYEFDDGQEAIMFLADFREWTEIAPFSFVNPTQGLIEFDRAAWETVIEYSR
jgi:hypothetical protein